MKTKTGTRVLMFLENCTYPKDGRVRREATAMLKAGYEVGVICPRASGQPRREVVDGVRVYRYRAPAPGHGLLSYVWEYGYSLTATFILSVPVVFGRGVDVIHLHNPPDLPILVAAVYKLLGKRVVYDHHDLAPELYHARFDDKGNPLVYRVLVFLEKLSCRLANLVIATNQSYKTIEMERGGVPEDRIAIVRNGPDLARVKRLEPDPAVRKKADFIIGYVGDIGFHDGLDYLLRALDHLVTDLERKNFCCVIIGTGDAWETARNLSEELKLTDYVWFTGFVPSDTDVMRYLSATDICVDPDPSNPFTDRSTMNKIMEYMALGKPTVAFDLPEHRVTAQEAAVYARANDELDFARRIVELMDDPARREDMGRVGQDRIKTQLAWCHQEQNLIDAYASLGLGNAGGSK